jgi:hypothetical protein
MTGFINPDGSALIGALNPSNVGQALQTDAAGNLKVTNGGGGATTLLNQASAIQNANGNSVDLNVAAFRELAIDANVTALGGAGGPAVQFFIDRKGADGVYYQIWNSAVINAAPGTASDSIGPGLNKAQSLGSVIRLRWVITGGGGNTATFSASLIAK